MVSSSSFSGSTLGAVVLALSLVVAGGCDAVPGKAGERQPPRVSSLQVVTDSVQVSEADSLAQVTLDLSVRAADPDGTIEQVVFLLEPSSNPQGTASGALRSAEGSLYAGRIQFAIPLVEEIYTVRVFAVDDDSLASNTVTGQFRFEPQQYIDAAAAGLFSRAAGGPSVQPAVRPSILPNLHTSHAHSPTRPRAHTRRVRKKGSPVQINRKELTHFPTHQ